MIKGYTDFMDSDLVKCQCCLCQLGRHPISFAGVFFQVKGEEEHVKTASQLSLVAQVLKLKFPGQATVDNSFISCSKGSGENVDEVYENFQRYLEAQRAQGTQDLLELPPSLALAHSKSMVPSKTLESSTDEDGADKKSSRFRSASMADLGSFVPTCMLLLNSLQSYVLGFV